MKKEVVLQFNEKDFTFVKDELGQLCISSTTHLVSYKSDTQTPALPIIRVYYLIGENETYKSITFKSENELISSGVVIAPNPRIFPTDSLFSSKPNAQEANYSDTVYPKQNIEYTGTHLMGGFKYLSFLVCPFNYDASAKNLYLKKNVTMTIETTIDLSRNSNASQAAFIDISILPTLQKLVINSDDAENLYAITNLQEEGLNRSSTTDYEYLIITSNALKSAFQPLADWKTMKGIRSKVLTTEEINALYENTGTSLESRIKHALQEYYNGTYSGLKYVLLGGDVNIVPSRMCYLEAQSHGKYYYGSTPTDMFYACFDGDFEWNNSGNGVYGELDDNVDLAPEIVVTRVPINTSSQASSFVNRIVNYERNPLSLNWQKKLLMAGHLLYSWNTAYGITDAEEKSDAFYSQYIQPYWDGDRTKLFNTISGDSAWVYNPSSLQTRLADGYSFVDINSHGSATTWQMRGDDRYTTDNAWNLVNIGRTIITTTACTTNAFDQNICLSKAFIQNSNSGILAYLGSSREAFSNVIPLLGLGASPENNGEFYKGLFTNSHKKFGKTITDAKVHFASSCSNYNQYRCIMFSLNPIGDPEMPVYIDTPQEFENLKISFSNGVLNVTAGESECTFCVSGTNYYDVQNGATASFSNVIDGYTVCVTKPGFIPFVATIRDTEYIQNTTLTGNNCFVATDVSAGYDVTTAIPYGNVTISSGNTDIYGTNTVTLKNNVTVQPGATLKITMGNQ